ncbi:integral peroxisomal membrane peroxin-domain-containing protein [Kockiozyma suomiensis]|uniref:integral peroxisomal membrane peroxin-domain-containing protein n=1 Tax=Kockiozyma suomiensis TaxID=1337062 RepID=UPI003343C1BC
MNYAPRSFRELTALKDILYGSDDETIPTASASAASRKDHLTDKIMERLFSAALPAAGEATVDAADVAERMQDQKNRPAFSVPLMARNFTRLNARIGVVFRLQYRAVRVFTWRTPSHTFSFLAVYSYLCLYPFLFVALPVAVLLLAVMVPAYVRRHPPPPSPLPAFPVPAGGPPLADAAELRPVPELSRDFLMNMRDIQNAMDDFTRTYDRLVMALSRPTNFCDEAYSSAVFLALILSGFVTFVAAPYIPWRLVFLLAGWLIVATGHPRARWAMKRSHDKYLYSREQKLSNIFERLVENDIVIDELPEVRHVEIFELQRQRNIDVDEWDDWLFGASPYEPANIRRVSKQRPEGVRFLDEVLPPLGWKFAQDSAWKLDLRPESWVGQRSVAGVEIDQGSKWVYDRIEDGSGKHNEWRRRRWIRACERQPIETMN